MKKSIKILIIEDDTFISMQLENAIVQFGHKVVNTVSNSDEAFETASINDIDLIISDINIKGELDGITTSKILYERYGTPVMFITAYKDIETLKRASLVDFTGYLMKPFREDELETQINLAILKYNLPKNKFLLALNDEYTYCQKENTLFYNENMVNLTKLESRFIQMLINSKGSILSYETIDQNLWYGKVVSAETRRQFIHRFNKKVSQFPFTLEKGVGCRLKL